MNLPTQLSGPVAVIGDVLDTFADIARGMAGVRDRRDDDEAK